MKAQFVENLQEGDVVNDHFVAIRRDLRTQQNGNKFLGMVFKDRTGEVGGILWRNAEAVARMFALGDVVNVRGTVTTYKDQLQIRVEQVLPLKENEYDTADLVFVPEGTAVCAAKLRETLAGITDPWLCKLTSAFLDDADFMAGFENAAAGKRWHHAYKGGLVRHVYEVARIAETMCELFPNIDRDLLLTAVFLHDIGKLDEMRHDIMVDYTTEGKLIGHVMLSAVMVNRKIESIEGFPTQRRQELLHCVLSHHGELVNGSPVVPKTVEAIVLNHCDDLDAQTDAVTQVVDETRKRGDEWSGYLPLIERQIWSKNGGRA